jgi:protein SCO1/2
MASPSGGAGGNVTPPPEAHKQATFPRMSTQTTRNRPRARFVLLGLSMLLTTLLLAVAAWRLGAAGRPAFHGTTYEELEPAPPLSLVDHTGRRVTLDDYRSEVVLLFFGYTHCPDVCPLTLAKLARVTESLGRKAREVRILLVTMDPARDTPQALAGYVRRFTPRAVGLTGDPKALEAAYRGYGAYTLPGGHHGMTHSSVVYGIDRAGRLRVVIPPEATEERVRDDVRTLLSL